MRRPWRTILILTLLAAAAVTGAFWLRQRKLSEGQPEILRQAEVTRGDLTLVVNASGNISMRRVVPLTFQNAGEVEAVLAKIGQRVHAEQPLARLSPGNLERAVAQAEIALAQAQTTLEQLQQPADPEDIAAAEAALDAAAQALELARLGRQTARVDAQAMVIQAQRQREQAFIKYRDAADGRAKERAQQQYEDALAAEHIAHLNAEQMQEQAEATWRSAYTAYQQAQRSLEQLQAGVSAEKVQQQELQVALAELRLDRARRALSDTIIRAPYDGVIGEVYVSPGSHVRPRDLAFVIVDDSAVFLDVTIDEIDIGRISVGQQAQVTLDAYPQAPFTATVASVAPAMADVSGVSGLAAYQVRLQLEPHEKLRILDGMTASVVIQTETLHDVLLCPLWAIRTDQTTGEIYTYRYEGQQVQRTPIVVGERDDTYAQILDGLKEGDLVVSIVEERTIGPAGR